MERCEDRIVVPIVSWLPAHWPHTHVLSVRRLMFLQSFRTLAYNFPFGGERGIRTLDTGLSPYASLAGRCLRPLGQLSVKLEQRAGFEPAAFRICNPVHWATLPPLHITHCEDHCHMFNRRVVD